MDVMLTSIRFHGLRRIPKQHHYSTISLEPVKLAYTKFTAPSTPSRQPFVICHSFLGSKQNWKTLGKAMSHRFNTDVYTLDMRNHGDSPHVEPHTYEAMAQDLKSWLQEQDIRAPTLIGHSMGGKAAMTFALLNQNLLSNLVVLDIAPLRAQLLHDFDNYCKGMWEIERLQLTRQTEANTIMARYEPDEYVRHFLLTNLKKSPVDGVYRFRVPLPIITNALGNMGDFIQGYKSSLPTLFVLGGASSYKKPFVTHPELVLEQFPASTINVIPGATHWLHSEQPDTLMDMISDFLRRVEIKQ